MAEEGVRLTSFYVAQAVCSASRAALLTGSYSNRVSINGALNHTADYGLNLDELTIAEVLKPRGYATGMFGKWHLGHRPPFLPLHQGFDEYPRTALLERHVATAPAAEELLSRPAVDGRRSGRQRSTPISHS